MRPSDDDTDEPDDFAISNPSERAPNAADTSAWTEEPPWAQGGPWEGDAASHPAESVTSAMPEGGRRSLWHDGSEDEIDGAPGEEPSGAAPPRPPVSRERRGHWLRGALFGLIALGVLALVLSLRPMLQDDEVVELELEGRLALLPVINETGSAAYDWMGDGWTEMVAEALSRTPGVHVVEPRRLAHEVQIRGLGRDPELARERLRGVAFAMGADLVLDAVVRRQSVQRDALRPLSGSGEPLLRIEFSLISADGTRVKQSQVRGDDPIQLGNLMVVSLARGLSGEGEPVRLERVFSTHPFLGQLYGVGLHAMRVGDLERAQDVFELIYEQEPRFLYAGLRLLETRMQRRDCLGCQDLAQELLRQTQVQAARRVESAVLEALARLEAMAGRGPASRELFSQARGVLPEDAQAAHLRIDRELSRLALVQGERDEAKALFHQQLQAEGLAGNVLGQASLFLELGSLALTQGDLGEAQQHLDEALALARQQEDPWLEARAVSSLGEVARQGGDAAEAIRLWQEALVFYRQPEDRRRRLLLLGNLSELALLERRFEEAEDHLYATRDLAAELESHDVEATASLRLAWIMLRTGYPRQAREHLDRTLELDRWITTERVSLQRVIAWFAYEQGNYRLAVETQQEARLQAGDAWRPIDDAFLRAYRQALTNGRRVPVPGEEGTATERPIPAA